MEGGNYLRMDVVGCLTPSPCITKSPNPSLIQDPVYMHILIRIIKPVNIGDQSHLKISPLPCPRTCQSTHTHTHTYFHMFTQYVHPSTQCIRNKVLSNPMGVGVGKHKINPQSRKIDIGEKTIFPASTTSKGRLQKCFP